MGILPLARNRSRFLAPANKHFSACACSPRLVAPIAAATDNPNRHRSGVTLAVLNLDDCIVNHEADGDGLTVAPQLPSFTPAITR
jgi:hypothetical protein